jgi:TonB C terminal
METLSSEPGTDVINRALLRTVCLLLLSFSPSAQTQTVSVEEREARRIAIRQELNELTNALRKGVAAELRQRDEQALAAERTKEFAPWISRIHERIRAKLAVPSDIPEAARAEYKVTLIPGGEVLGVELRSSSGYASYDDAIRRAILSAAPLPVPSDVDLFQQFRELVLVFRAGAQATTQVPPLRLDSSARTKPLDKGMAGESSKPGHSNSPSPPAFDKEPENPR